MASPYPFVWTETDVAEQEKRASFWTSPNAISVKQMISHPMYLNMPKYFIGEGMHEKIWNMKPRPDDLWIVTYPKSGTTMSAEMLWQLSTGCDVKSKASKRKLTIRCPFVEFSCLGGINGMKMKTPNFDDDEQKKEHEL